jgi:hypothetical protein
MTCLLSEVHQHWVTAGTEDRMKFKVIWILLFMLAGTVSIVPSSWAKETCYNYIIAYSYRDKAVYHTPIFTRKIKGVSYNEEEYVADTATLLKMESAFQKHLTQKLKITSRDITVGARVAFKTEDIAKNRIDKEVGDFRFRGFEIKTVSDFKFD